MEMQAPTAPHFTQVTKATLNHLTGQLTALKLQYDQANPGNQQGGWKRPVDPRISVAYQNKIKEIERQLQIDIDQVDHNCTLLANHIQELLDLGKGFVVSAQKAVDLYEADPGEASLDQAVRATQHAAVLLDHIANAAKEADLAYGQAWFAYRENLAISPVISKKYFDAKRKDIMARGKMTTAKIVKCEQLHEQAQAFHGLSIKLARLAAGDKVKQSDVKQTAKRLEAQLRESLNTKIINRDKLAWEEDGRVWQMQVGRLRAMSEGNITKEFQAEAVTRMADLTAMLKIFRNQLKTMETVLATAKKPLTPKQIESQKNLFQAAEASVARARQIVQQATQLEAQAQNYTNTIRQAQV